MSTLLITQLSNICFQDVSSLHGAKVSLAFSVIWTFNKNWEKNPFFCGEEVLTYDDNNARKYQANKNNLNLIRSQFIKIEKNNLRVIAMPILNPKIEFHPILVKHL